MDKKKILIEDKLRLIPLSEHAITFLAKDKKRLQEYINKLQRTYNKMVDFVNDEHGRRENLKECLDELWEQYGVASGFEPQDIVIQAENRGKKEILDDIREKSGLYDEDGK